MNERLTNVFSGNGGPALSIFFTAGYPEKNSTVQIGEALAEAGADFLEIGIPFSDPVADGPVIQASSGKALENGMTLPLLLDQVAELRSKTSVPLFVMGYLNPVLQYGMEKFLDRLQEAGVDGVILPDLPASDFADKYQAAFQERGIHNVFLVTPQTSEERIRELDRLSSGFLYAVSSPSITGSKLEASAERDAYLERLASYQLQNPIIVGFGISDNESFRAVSEHTSGAIVGSAFIRHIEEHGVDGEGISQFVKSIRGGAK